MTTEDKTVLLHFICRPGMFIISQNRDNFISFITGYEMGSKSCHFTEPLETYISDKFKIQLNSGRWFGQIDHLSKKLSLNWIATFKKMALELLVEEQSPQFTSELNTTFKSRFYSLINRINPAYDPWFNDLWTQDWIALCSTKKTWFRDLWTDEEFKIINSIDQKVQSGKIFVDTKHTLPTIDLLEDKIKFDGLKIKDGI